MHFDRTTHFHSPHFIYYFAVIHLFSSLVSSFIIIIILVHNCPPFTLYRITHKKSHWHGRPSLWKTSTRAFLLMSFTDTNCQWLYILWIIRVQLDVRLHQWCHRARFDGKTEPCDVSVIVSKPYIQTSFHADLAAAHSGLCSTRCAM